MTDDIEQLLEDERAESRRSVLAGLGFAGLLSVVTGGSALWLQRSLANYGQDDGSDIIIYENGETYEGGPEDVPNQDDIPEESYRRVNSWEEALPGGCGLNQDEKNWLVDRLDEDEYENLDPENFFDYVGREVRLDKRGDELRMTVDSDYSGDFDADTHYVVEKGYNVPEAC